VPVDSGVFIPVAVLHLDLLLMRAQSFYRATVLFMLRTEHLEQSDGIINHVAAGSNPGGGVWSESWSERDGVCPCEDVCRNGRLKAQSTGLPGMGETKARKLFARGG